MTLLAAVLVLALQVQPATGKDVPGADSYVIKPLTTFKAPLAGGYDYATCPKGYNPGHQGGEPICIRERPNGVSDAWWQEYQESIKRPKATAETSDELWVHCTDCGVELGEPFYGPHLDPCDIWETWVHDWDMEPRMMSGFDLAGEGKATRLAGPEDVPAVKKEAEPWECFRDSVGCQDITDEDGKPITAEEWFHRDASQRRQYRWTCEDPNRSLQVSVNNLKHWCHKETH